MAQQIKLLWDFHYTFENQEWANLTKFILQLLVATWHLTRISKRKAFNIHFHLKKRRLKWKNMIGKLSWKKRNVSANLRSLKKQRYGQACWLSHHDFSKCTRRFDLTREHNSLSDNPFTSGLYFAQVEGLGCGSAIMCTGRLLIPSLGCTNVCPAVDTIWRRPCPSCTLGTIFFCLKNLLCLQKSTM